MTYLPCLTSFAETRRRRWPFQWWPAVSRQRLQAWEGWNWCVLIQHSSELRSGRSSKPNSVRWNSCHWCLCKKYSLPHLWCHRHCIGFGTSLNVHSARFLHWRSVSSILFVLGRGISPSDWRNAVDPTFNWFWNKLSWKAYMGEGGRLTGWGTSRTYQENTLRVFVLSGQVLSLP